MLQACDVNWTNILVDASCFLKMVIFCSELATNGDILLLIIACAL